MQVLKADKIAMGLVVVILIAFTVGGYRVQQQATDLNRLLKAQTPLIFAFENPQTGATVLVTCDKKPSQPRYICTSETITKQ